MIKQIVFLVTIISILVTKQASSQSFECINIEDPDWMQGSEILIQTIDSVEVTLLMEEGRAREKYSILRYQILLQKNSPLIPIQFMLLDIIEIQ